MDENRISSQQELEHPDSGEGADPVPIAVSLLVACMMLFGTSCIFSEDQSPPEKGSTFKGGDAGIQGSAEGRRDRGGRDPSALAMGQQGDPIAQDVVAKARAETAGRSDPWNGDAELAALK
jgi:hypothetical protein